MSGSQINDTPRGAICVSPWANLDKTLVVDLNVHLSGVRTSRNILSNRNGIKSASNNHEEIGHLMNQVASGQPPDEFVYTHKPSNTATIMVCDRPVRVKIKNLNGEIDLGLQLTFIMTAPLVSITIVNEKNEGTAELNLVII